MFTFAGGIRTHFFIRLQKIHEKVIFAPYDNRCVQLL